MPLKSELGVIQEYDFISYHSTIVTILVPFSRYLRLKNIVTFKSS